MCGALFLHMYHFLCLLFYLSVPLCIASWLITFQCRIIQLISILDSYGTSPKPVASSKSGWNMGSWQYVS